MSSISDNLQAVLADLQAAARAVGRDPAEIRLLAVSKTFGIEAIVDAVQAGQRCFGENYVQEALLKIQQAATLMPMQPLEWHFIGPIQSNKTKAIAENFSWVHSVDREKIAERLSAQRPPELGALQICLQVNISGEASKSGVAPNDLLALAKSVLVLPNLTLRGLMAVPEATDNAADQEQAFASIVSLKNDLAAHGIIVDTLSMGMSADMPAAIAQGSTILRIGSAIFGKRNYAHEI
ncbi:MAG: YggS family pyridoxal phosphate-dependent enzyme [Undibacterium sp.]|nr:YggS family pyridoxal phosphate-dependent enzyme [Undibacterium sp.]